MLALTLCSCADEKTLNGVTYKPYGWMDKNRYKSDKVIYEVSTGNIVWSILLYETIVAPVVLTGMSLYKPVALKCDSTYYIH